MNREIHPRAFLGIVLVLIGFAIAGFVAVLGYDPDADEHTAVAATMGVAGFIALSGVIIFAASPSSEEWARAKEDSERLRRIAHVVAAPPPPPPSNSPPPAP